MHEALTEIERRREKLGVSQSEMCRQADVHPTTYNKLLQGHTGQPQRRTLMRLRKALAHFEQEEDAA